MSRYDSSVARKAAFHLGARLAPKTAGRLGWNLFRTPLVASKPTELQKEVLSQAERSEIEFEGRTLRVYHWGQTGPVVLMVHGWGGRAHVFGGFVQEILARRMRVVSFDGPAHNGQGGKTEMLEYSRAVQAVAAKIGLVSGLVGHSFGAMTSAYTAPKLSNLKALALVGSPDSLEYVLGRAQEKMMVPPQVMEYIYAQIERVSGIPVRSHASSLYLKGSEFPKLIVHDEDDREIPFVMAKALAAGLQADFFGTQGLGHHRVLNCPQVAQKVAQFLERHLL